jgi:hypothetical protein
VLRITRHGTITRHIITPAIPVITASTITHHIITAGIIIEA